MLCGSSVSYHHTEVRGHISSEDMSETDMRVHKTNSIINQKQSEENEEENRLSWEETSCTVERETHFCL